MIDLCIVGSGVAGSLIAYEAAKAGKSVLILETGKRYDPLDAELYERVRLQLYPWQWEDAERDAFEVDPAMSVRLNGGRVKAVGGTTLHWNAYTPRWQPHDFSMKSEFGIARDWPLSYADIEPYYVRAERELGVSGGDAPGMPPRSAAYALPPHPYSYSDKEIFSPAFEKAGYTLGYNPMAVASQPYDGRAQCVGFTTCAPMCGSGAKYTGMVHVRKAEATGKVEVRSECHVRRIKLASARKISHVEYIDNKGAAQRVEARTFVIAAGGIENARLLLLSAADGPHSQGLANESGLVGRTLMFHTAAGVRATMKERVGGHRIGFGTSICWDLHQARNFPNIGNMILFPADLQGPMPAAIAKESGLTGAALKDHVRKSYGSNVKIIAEGEMMPVPENRVSLSETKKDGYGDPVPRISMKMGDFERRTMDRGLEVGRKIMEIAGATKIWTDSGPLGGHYMGSTCMGTDRRTSVCDKYGRCHSLDNLYIAGSSIFATSSASHPTLTIATLALHAADHIKTL
jgi:choline dehydrogenase-like flavoprotein